MKFGWRARIGQIRPATAIEGAEEWRRVAPEGVAFIDARMLLQEVSETGLEEMMAQLLTAAKQVAQARPDVIVQCGAPGTFLRGYGHDQVVIDEIEKETGVKATTMMWAMVEGLRAVGSRKPAVGTIYNESVNQKLSEYMGEAGFEVSAMGGLQITAPEDCIDLMPEDAYRLGRQVFDQSGRKADAILISCGGFRTFEAIDALEKDTGVPVVTSNQASLWLALRMAGVRDEVPSLGRLFKGDMI